MPAVVISSALTLADTISGGGVINADNPLIGYENRVTTANLSTSTEASGYPASNLANPSTALEWIGVASSPEADEYIRLDLDTAEMVDYVAVARTNWGSAQIPVSIEALDPDQSPESWTEIIGETLLPDDGPALFRFTPQGVTALRIRLQPGTAAPSCAVVYAGKLLILQRRIHGGHTPITYGRETTKIGGRSMAGHYLGEIVIGSRRSTSVTLKNLTPAWYRTYLDPFVAAAAAGAPAFFAWRPSSYPNEIGYVAVEGDPRPVNMGVADLMQIELSLNGVA